MRLIHSQPALVESAILPPTGNDGLDVIGYRRTNRKEDTPTIAVRFAAVHFDELASPRRDAGLGAREQVDGTRFAAGDVWTPLMECNERHRLRLDLPPGDFCGCQWLV